MTQNEHPRGAPQRGQPDRPAPRARLVSGGLALALMSSFGALTSFYLMLSVTPMYAMSAGAGSAEAGIVTGSLMLATVLAEFASPRLMRRHGYRTVFAVGALLLGGPALALLTPHHVVTIVAVSIARGVGFGLSTVVIGALVAKALPPERRGEGIGVAGVAACVPAIVALPSGVWLAENTGYAVVIAMTAVSALAPLVAIPWLVDPAVSQAEAAPGAAQPASLLASLRSGGQLRPSLVFAAATVFGRRGRRVPSASGWRFRWRRRARFVRTGCGLDSEPLVGRAPRRPARSCRPAGSWAADRRRRDGHPDLGGGPGGPDRWHVPIRDRLRDQPERHLCADDRTCTGLRLRHGQRPVEPGL